MQKPPAASMDPKHRSLVCRMAGNIAGHFADDKSPAFVAERSVEIAMAIIDAVERVQAPGGDEDHRDAERGAIRRHILESKGFFKRG